MTMSIGKLRARELSFVIPYGFSHLVICLEARMGGWSGLGTIQFWGLEDNLGLWVCFTGSGRGGGMNGTDPLVDVM